MMYIFVHFDNCFIIFGDMCLPKYLEFMPFFNPNNVKAWYFLLTVVVPEKNKVEEQSKAAVWGCPICTYDNDECMSACEICGVLRNPLVKRTNTSNTDSG